MEHTVRFPISLLPAAAFPVLCCGLVGCAEGARDAAPGSVPVWRLSSEPLLEIGVVEGDTNYELFQATSSIRLDDGRIVVANGRRELRFYDASGRFVLRAGGRGRGPGEFSWLLRIYRYGADSILALDWAGNRVSVFDTQGKYARLAEADSMSEDPEFPLDVWLYRRFWVDGALVPQERRAVRQALERLEVPADSAPAYRFVRVDNAGNVWIREPLGVDADAWQWHVVDLSGQPVATIETSLRFDLHHIGPDFVLGRWRDENDVNFIRLYRLEVADVSARVPDWVTTSASDVKKRTPTGEEEEQLLSTMRASLRQVVTAQEMYFADHMTYTENRHELEWSPPEGVSLDIIAAHGTGWVAVATHRDLPVICGMGVGAATPPGWAEGAPKCGQ